MNTATRFRNLAIGQTFDFVNPADRTPSFLHRCTKLSARTYRWLTVHGWVTSQVGTINVPVFHIGEQS